MANIKSAKKRINTIKRQREENKYIKATLKTYHKEFVKLLADGKVEEAEKKLPSIVSYFNSSCSKGVIHKNNASRHIARLYYALNNAKLANTAAQEKVAKEEVVEQPKAEVVAEVKEAKKETKTAPKKVVKTDDSAKVEKTTEKKVSKTSKPAEKKTVKAEKPAEKKAVKTAKTIAKKETKTTK